MRVIRPDGGNRDFFVYGTDAITLAANESRPVNIPVQADADFEAAYLIGASTTAAAFTVMIADNASNLNLFNVPLLDSLILGTPQRPFVLPETHIFARNGSILIQLVNLTGGANTVRVYLAGFKWFTRPATFVGN